MDQEGLDALVRDLEATLGNSISTKAILVADGSCEMSRCWATVIRVRRTSLWLDLFADQIDAFHADHVCSTRTLAHFAALLVRATARADLEPFRLARCVRALVDGSARFLVERSGLVRHFPTREAEMRSVVDGLCRGEPGTSRVLWALLQRQTLTGLSLDRVLLVPDSGRRVDDDDDSDDLVSVHDGVVLDRGHLVAGPARLLLLSAVLVNSSLAEGHLHAGFNKKLAFTSLASSIDPAKKRTSLVDFLVSNGINAILSKERLKLAAETMEECARRGLELVLIDALSTEQFLAVQSLFGRSPLTYWTDFRADRDLFRCRLERASERHVVLKRCLDDKGDSRSSSSQVLSVLFHVRVFPAMQTELLRHHLKRLLNVLNDDGGRYLPGGGVVERRIALDFLSELSFSRAALNAEERDLFAEDDKDDDVYLESARALLVEVFLQTARTIETNSDPDSAAFDDLTSKLAAWRVAAEALNGVLVSISHALYI